MTAFPKRETMSADAFLEWAEAQDDGPYQLIGGEIVAMAPERVEHSYVKFQVAKAFEAAIAKAGLPCRAFVDGVSVKIDDATVFEPDALVNCGAPIPRHSLIAPNPVIVVEVISPTSTRRDLAVKFTNYFRHPGVQHYLVVVLENRTVIQHSRAEGDTLKTRIAGIGQRVTFDPPGIAVAVSDLFGDLDSGFAD
ncbi:MAG: Uma2 family endonuclease [Rhodomicrobium sp.]